MRVYKVEADPLSRNALVAGTPLSAGLDPRGVLCVWFDADSDQRWEAYVVGTGHPVVAGWTYLAHVLDGQFVWHVLVRPLP